MAIEWTHELIEEAVELIQKMTSNDVAAEMSKRHGVVITGKAILGRLHRSGIKVEKFGGVRTSGCTTPRPRGTGEKKPRKRKPKTNALNPFQKVLQDRKMRFEAIRKASTGKYLTVRGRPVVPLYKPLGTCQYIGDVPGKCGKPSHGSWCDEHKKIVFKSI